MTNKPRNFYQVADAFGDWMGEKPIERIEWINARPRSIDLSQFNAEELRWMSEEHNRDIARDK